MVKVHFSYFILLLLCASCKDSQCDLKNIKNKNRSDINDCLVGVVADEQFYLSSKTSLYEYQNGLLDLIKNLPSGDSILVRETMMQKEKRKVIIWFIKGTNDWVVANNLEIAPGVDY